LIQLNNTPMLYQLQYEWGRSVVIWNRKEEEKVVEEA
jgi:hypothetical protein